MDVILYTTGCPRCIVLKKKLDAKGVEYETITDVNKMIKMGLKETPVLSVDGVRMGFSEANKWTDKYGN